MLSKNLSSDSDLAQNVKKFRINAIEPIKPKKFSNNRREVFEQNGKLVDTDRGKPFHYERLIESMYAKAQEHGRNFRDDVCFMISTYYVHGNNIDRLLQSSSLRNEKTREKLTELQSVYGMRSRREVGEFSFSLNRVSEAFPHVSLVLADMLNSTPGRSLLRFCVTSKDLAAEVHHHFKLNYFSSLIDVTDRKAQIALLVHNLCHAKSVVNTRGMNEIDGAFVTSCKLAGHSLTQKPRLAPEDARQKFTKHIIESFSFNADSLSLVWDRVIGETRIPICGSTMITSFHEQVLNRQPLDLSKWRQLLDEGNADGV